MWGKSRLGSRLIASTWHLHPQPMGTRRPMFLGLELLWTSSPPRAGALLTAVGVFSLAGTVPGAGSEHQGLHVVAVSLNKAARPGSHVSCLMQVVLQCRHPLQ